MLILSEKNINGSGLLIENAITKGITTEFIINEETKKKDYYVSGVYLQAEQKNKNGRVYPKYILEREVNIFNHLIKEGKAFGELSHPNHLDINPDRISHRITELFWDGNDVIGKAKILNTRCGKNVLAMIEDGIGKIGMSSRGSGSVKNSIVQEDFGMKTIDLVVNPSANSIMNIIREQEEILLNANVPEMLIEKLQYDIKHNKFTRKEFDRQLLERFKKLFVNKKD